MTKAKFKNRNIFFMGNPGHFSQYTIYLFRSTGTPYGVLSSLPGIEAHAAAEAAVLEASREGFPAHAAAEAAVLLAQGLAPANFDAGRYEHYQVKFRVLRIFVIFVSFILQSVMQYTYICCMSYICIQLHIHDLQPRYAYIIRNPLHIYNLQPVTKT